jgi:hypothetical protein
MGRARGGKTFMTRTKVRLKAGISFRQIVGETQGPRDLGNTEFCTVDACSGGHRLQVITQAMPIASAPRWRVGDQNVVPTQKHLTPPEVDAKLPAKTQSVKGLR